MSHLLVGPLADMPKQICLNSLEIFFFQAEDGIRDCLLSRGLGDVYKRQHISSALGVKCLALFMDSPVQAYGKYSKNIEVIVPEGETEETTTHDTLGADKISFEKVFNKSIELLN